MGTLELVKKELSTKECEFVDNYFKNAPKWIKSRVEIVRVEKGSEFIVENEIVDSIYILLKGIVIAREYRVIEVVYDYITFEVFHAFGALEVIIDADRYQTTLLSKTKCLFLRLPRDEYAKWLLEDINMMKMQMKMNVSALLEQAKHERIFMFMHGKEKLILLFIKLYDENQNNGLCELSLTQESLSEVMGCSIKTIHRATKSLCEEGLIEKRRNKFIISKKQYQEMKAFLSDKVAW